MLLHTDSNKPLAVGIVGAGEITRRLHLPVLSNMPDVKISWLYDVSAPRSNRLAHAWNLRALHTLRPDQLPRCDVALLAIPMDARRDYLDHFASVGTAVLCEKPFAVAAGEHTRIVEQFAPHMLGCGLMRRFYRSTLLLRRVVTSSMFGSLLRIDIGEGNRSKGSGVDSSFLDDPKLGAARGVLMDLGSHSLDLALFITNAESFRVKSCAKEMDGAVDRKIAAKVELHSSTSSAPCELNYCVSWLDRQTNRIRLEFERLVMWSDLSASSGVYLGDPDIPREAMALSDQSAGATTFNQAFYLEWRSFLDGVRARRESLISARSAILTTALAETLLTGDSRPNA